MKGVKAYLITTGTVFGLIVVMHSWRVFAEGAAHGDEHLVRADHAACGRVECVGVAAGADDEAFGVKVIVLGAAVPMRPSPGQSLHFFEKGC